MAAPSMIIKIEGLRGIESISGQPSVGTLKLQGISAGKAAGAKTAATAPVTAAAKAGGTTSAASSAAAGKGAAVSSKGAVATLSPAAGWSLGLGSVGPWLVVGAAGVVAAGLYLYFRNRAVSAPLPEPDEF